MRDTYLHTSLRCACIYVDKELGSFEFWEKFLKIHGKLKENLFADPKDMSCSKYMTNDSLVNYI